MLEPERRSRKGKRAIHKAPGEFTQFLVMDTPPCQYCRIHMSDTQDPLILPVPAQLSCIACSRQGQLKC